MSLSPKTTCQRPGSPSTASPPTPDRTQNCIGEGPREKPRRAGSNLVAPGYLDVMGIARVAGRDFAATDQPGSLPLLEPKGVIYSSSFFLDVSKLWEHRAQLLNDKQLKDFRDKRRSRQHQ